MILIPYFFWAFALYLFWFFVGRNFGISSQLDLSPTDNLIGIFYSQGGQAYMDWGIPIWFLTCIFLVFLVYSLMLKIENKILFLAALILCVVAGLIWPKIADVHLPWSFDVAFVATGIYAVGHHTKNWMIGLKKRPQVIWMLLLFIIHITTFLLNTLKVDMYRSLYGHELLFLISGITGSVAYILLLKTIPLFRKTYHSAACNPYPRPDPDQTYFDVGYRNNSIRILGTRKAYFSNSSNYSSNSFNLAGQ